MIDIYTQQCLAKAYARTISVLGLFSSITLALTTFGLQMFLGIFVGFSLLGDSRTVIIAFIIFGFSIVISFVIIFGISFVWESQSSFVRVDFEPKIIADIEEDKVYIDLVINNPEPVEIKETYISIVSLSRLFAFHEKMQLSEIEIETDRLQWDSKYADETGKNTVALDSKNEKVHFVILDRTTSKMKFCYNEKVSKEYGTNEVFLLKLRIDGKVGDKNIAPKYFEGYLYIKFDIKIVEGTQITTETINANIEKIQHEKFQDVIMNPIVDFDRGDWRKSEIVHPTLKKYKIFPVRYLKSKSLTP